MDPARLAPTVPPGGTRRSRRPRARGATDISVVAPRPLSADVLRAMPVTPTGWPDRGAPRPVADDGPVVRLASEPRGTATASSGATSTITMIPGDPTESAVPSVQGSTGSFDELLASSDMAPPASMQPASRRASIAPRSPAPSIAPRTGPQVVLVRAPEASIPAAGPPSAPESAAFMPSHAEVGATMAPAAGEASRTAARSVLPVQPKNPLGTKPGAAAARGDGRWARIAVSLVMAVAAGVGGFFWTARQAAREAVRESTAQVDAVRGAVTESQERVGGLEGRAPGWDRGVEKIAGLATASEQHGEDIDALRAKISRLESDVGTSHDRQRRLQSALELQAIREQTAWAFPKHAPPGPEPALAATKAAPSQADMNKRVHATKTVDPFAPTRPLPR